MIQKKKINKEVEVIEEILCNKCGESCIPGKHDEVYDAYGLIEKTARGGYWSPELYDDVSYTFSLCEKCLRELFDSFKIPPQTKGGGLICHDEEREYETKEIREQNRIEWKNRK
jgi:hypothetical protein